MARKQAIDQEVTEIEEQLTSMSRQYEKLKTLLNQKQQARSRRQHTKPTIEMIADCFFKCSVQATRGDQECLGIYSWWGRGSSSWSMGLFVTCGSQELLDSLISKYKRGKYLQGIIKKAIEENSQSKSSLKQALAFKYQNFLSWRKFNLMCKTQSSVFDPNAEVWLPRNVKCLGVDVDVSINKILDEKLEKCVKSLDIGSINQIPNVPGVSRTITGLVFMIMDLHLQLPHLCWQLTWFNENNNHFIFQFSDDGTPETSQLTMSIGSLTLWNLGEQVRSREFQYLLHCIWEAALRRNATS